MRALILFGFTVFVAGFYISFLNDCWSYFADFTPPSGDIFYTLMLVVWHGYPYFIMIFGLVLALLGSKGKTFTVVEE